MANSGPTLEDFYPEARKPKTEQYTPGVGEMLPASRKGLEALEERVKKLEADVKRLMERYGHTL